MKNRTFIDERPEVINEKQRLGDWEIDTIIGKSHKQAIVTIVERISKLTVLKKVSSKNVKLVAEATINGLSNLSPNFVLSITSDNGPEFTRHEKISESLGVDFYFTHPYSSWERGLNENTNGLVRQYLKKGVSFSDVTDESLGIIADELNNRPRKSLRFRTPNEVYSIKF